MPDPNADIAFLRQRTRLLSLYAAQPAPYQARTKPYKSTVQFQWPVVDKFPGTATMAHAILRSGIEVLWFGYKIGDSIQFGPGTKVANETDTNLSTPRRTNGIDDMVIEGISATCKGARVDYSAATYTGTDTDAIQAYLGNRQLYDPAALAAPPQLWSPINSEMVLFEALKPNCAIEFEWDRQRIEKIGTLDEIPEGGAKSFLHASGDPRTDNRYRIPEGYLWRHEGVADSEFVCRGRTYEAVVVPISLVATQGGATLNVPNNLWLDVTVRLHGLVLSNPSQN